MGLRASCSGSDTLYKSGGSSPGALDQLGNGVAQLRTLALPMAHALQLDAQRFLAFCHERVVKTDALDEATVAAIARIGHYYIKKRTVLGTTTGKTNYDHKKPIKMISQAKGREFYVILGTSCNKTSRYPR